MKSDALMLLELEHGRLSQILDVMDRELTEAEAHRPFDGRLVEQALRYLSEFPDSCHHPKEDLIARRLQRSSAAADGESGTELEADHERLSGLTHQAARLFAAGDDEAGEKIPELREYVAAYRQHIRHENEHFFPLALRTLSQSDFADIDFQLFDAPDPVFDAAREERFSALRKELLQEVQS